MLRKRFHLPPGALSAIVDAAAFALLLLFLFALWVALPGGEALAQTAGGFSPAGVVATPFAITALICVLLCILAETTTGLGRAAAMVALTIAAAIFFFSVAVASRAGAAAAGAASLMADLRRHAGDRLFGALVSMIGCVIAIATLAAQSM